MRDLEHMKNPVKRMYDKFSNKFDEYIYDLVQEGHAYKIHGSIEELSLIHISEPTRPY